MYQHREGVGLVAVGDHPPVEQVAVDVVFFHGLTGHAYKTWLNPETQFQWPEALAESGVGARVWAVHYPSALLAKFAYLAQAQEGTDDVAHRLATYIAGEAASRLLQAGGPPCVFICHSLGGIVAKRLLLYADRVKTMALLDHPAFDPAAVRGMLFLGTPHRGSNLATYGTALEAAARTGIKAVEALLGALDVVVPNHLGPALKVAAAIGPATTVLAEELTRGNDGLTELHRAFSMLYQQRWQQGNGLIVQAGVELQPPIAYPNLLVVDPESADPKLAAQLHQEPVPPLRINLDHSAICKPRGIADEVYGWALNLLSQVQPGAGLHGLMPLDSAELLLWRIKWAMQACLANNVSLRKAWASSRGDGSDLANPWCPREIAAKVAAWVGDGSPDALVLGMSGLTELLQNLREAGHDRAKDKVAVRAGMERLFSLMCVGLGCPAGSSDPVLQPGWRARRSELAGLLNELTAAGHKGRSAQLRYDVEKQAWKADAHQVSANDLCSADLRVDRAVTNLELTVHQRAKAGGTQSMTMSLSSLRQPSALQWSEDIRQEIKPTVLGMLRRHEGVVIDDLDSRLVANDVGLMAQLNASPLAPVTSVITSMVDDTMISIERQGLLVGALTEFQNELRKWSEA